VAIPGETGATYTIVAADSGADIDYIETATNAEGSATQDSNDITAQTFVSPTIGGVPTIAGTEEVGETLTATAAAATGNPAPTTSWQWQRSADGSTGWADIAGATASTYTLVAADETNYVRVKQIETNALGTDEAVSAATGQIVASSATGILDSYTGAAFAFAPDTLIYSGFSVTDNTAGSNTNGSSGEFTVLVRRDSDNALQSFTWEEVGDGTLVTWVGAGNDGFVQVGYDQSGSDNHASQTTAANQPKIVDNGVLVVENGKAALYFDGVNHWLVSPMDEITNDFSIFSALKTITVQDVIYAYSYDFPDAGFLFRSGNSANNYVTFFDDGSESSISGFRLFGEYFLSSNVYDNGSYTMYSNGTSFASGSDNYNLVMGQIDFIIGKNPIINTAYLLGAIGTIIAYPTLPTRAGIETAINNEYNIY
jgi:hypothetical protein